MSRNAINWMHALFLINVTRTLGVQLSVGVNLLVLALGLASVLIPLFRLGFGVCVLASLRSRRRTLATLLSIFVIRSGNKINKKV